MTGALVAVSAALASVSLVLAWSARRVFKAAEASVTLSERLLASETDRKDALFDLAQIESSIAAAVARAERAEKRVAELDAELSEALGTLGELDPASARAIAARRLRDVLREPAEHEHERAAD